MDRTTLYRIWRDEGLAVRRRDGAKRAIGPRARMAMPRGPNLRWSLNRVSDGLSDGRRFRVLCVIDDVGRECPAPVADTCLSGLRAGHARDDIARGPGNPCRVVSDEGTERTEERGLHGEQGPARYAFDDLESLDARRMTARRSADAAP